MRKLLLATAAILGATAGLTGLASAQTETLQGTVATPASGGSYTYGDNNYMGGTMTKGAVANPTPGTMVIRLGVRMDVGVTGTWSNLDNYSSAGDATGVAAVDAANKAAGNTVAGARKLSPVQLLEYMRIYPGVDAMAANGLRYGAAIELRQNYAAAGQAETLTNGGTGNTSNQTVYVRRAFAYIAADQFGIVRLGEMDGLIGTYDEGGATTGVFLSPSGTIVGGNLEAALPGNATMLPYFAAQSGNEYGNTKIVYLSPSFYGFDFGVQYAPNPFNGYQAEPIDGSCPSAAGTGCPNVASSTTPLSGSVVQNQYAVGARYQGKLGPAAVLAYAVYMGSGHTNYTGAPIATGVGTGTLSGKFDNLSLGMFGANVTMDGLSVFGNIMTGQFNGILAAKPDGAPDATGFGAGLKYAFGPYTIGAVYSQFDSQGAWNLTGVSQRHEWVFSPAATYSPAPGLTFYLDYVYSQRHQGDFNFATNAVGTAYNNVTSQGVMFGTVVKW